LAKTHGTGSRGGAASIQRPRCLPPQLGRQTEPSSRLQSHKAPSPHQAPLQHDHIELPAKLLNYFLRSNRSNINQMLSKPSGEGCAQIMVGDHGHTLPGSPAKRQKLACNAGQGNPRCSRQLGAPRLVGGPRKSQMNLGPSRGPIRLVLQILQAPAGGLAQSVQNRSRIFMDISNVRRHIPEGFSQCSPTAYSPSIIIELAKLLYIQPAPANPTDSSRVATNLRQILRFLGPPAALCEWRPINTSSMTLRPAAQGHTFQSTIHNLA